MTDREKIVKIIRNMDSQSDTLDAITLGDIRRIADALIANGYGNVAEYKRRAEVAEKEREEYRNSNRIVLRGIEIIKRNILHYCATDFPTILQQAEKELQEEGKE